MVNLLETGVIGVAKLKKIGGNEYEMLCLGYHADGKKCDGHISGYLKDSTSEKRACRSCETIHEINLTALYHVVRKKKP